MSVMAIDGALSLHNISMGPLSNSTPSRIWVSFGGSVVLRGCRVQSAAVSFDISRATLVVEDSTFDRVAPFRQLTSIFRLTSSKMMLNRTLFSNVAANATLVELTGDSVGTCEAEQLTIRNVRCAGVPCFVVRGTLVLHSLQVEHTETTAEGPLLRLESQGSAVCHGCTFMANQLTGALLQVRDDAKMVFNESHFTGNQFNESAMGLGIAFDSASIEVARTTFECNTFSNGTAPSPFHSTSGAALVFENSEAIRCNVQCPAGQQRLSNGLECQPCPAGSFSSAWSGAEPCTQCSVGSAMADEGAFACDPCPSGHAAPSTGSLYCARCSNAFVTSGEGDAFCEQFTVFAITVGTISAGLVIVPLAALIVGRFRLSTKEGSVLE